MASTQSGTSGSGSSSSKTVLVVEDNELNKKLLEDLIQTRGHRVLSAVDGSEALDLVRAHRPDLVLMDIQLPEVSGLEITKIMKADPALRHIPVIAVTAFAMKGDEERILDGGCSAYIAKPVSVIQLLETVDRFLTA